MAWQEWQGKKVYVEVKIKDGIKRYSGIIETVQFLGKNIDSVETYFLLMKDKFNESIGFPSTSINLIQEER